MRFKNITLVASLLLVIFFLFQIMSPVVEQPRVTGRIKAPADVSAILERACFNCHSNENKLRWFDKVAPASWLVNSDIRRARSAFNLSTWDSLSAAAQQGEFWEMVNMAISGKMPLGAYAALHSSAHLSPEDLVVLKKYALSLSTFKPQDSVLIAAADREFAAYQRGKRRLTDLPTAANGVSYFTGYETWQVISTTNRFDNIPSIRVVFGNTIAVKAIRENQIAPWPEGAIIVKVVWNITEDKNGVIRPQTVNSVQFMIKDGERFPDSKGWGFAKFDGINLVPFGKTAAFNTTCLNCHKLCSETGYVFNVPQQDSVKKREIFDAGALQLITTFANRSQQTMSTLYGNETALKAAMMNTRNREPGAVYALVTWNQANDKYWYGSYISGSLKSVETIRINADTTIKSSGSAASAHLILDLRPSILP
jgi:hypothetical protein